MIGDGWTETTSLKTSECLIVKDFDAKGRKTYWRGIDLGSGKSFSLGGNRHSESDALYCPQSEELVFADQHDRFSPEGVPVDTTGRPVASQTGLWSYHLPTGRETKLCDLDADRFRIIPLWAAANGESVYFLQEKRDPTRSELIRSRFQQRTTKRAPVEHQLFVFSRSSAVPTAISGILQDLVSFEVDGNTHSFFATTIDGECNTTLLRIDLATRNPSVLGHFPKRIVSLETGTETKIESWPEYRRVSATTRGDLLLTGHLGSRICRFIPPDTESEIVAIGQAPSYSPDGTRLAFLRRVGNGLWLKEGNADPLPIYQFSRSGISRKPVWCLCGGHVAASLFATQGEQQGITLVADVKRRELFAIRHSEHPYFPSGYTWISAVPESAISQESR